MQITFVEKQISCMQITFVEKQISCMQINFKKGKTKMEDLQKLLTELAEAKIEAITGEELNHLIDMCKGFKNETDCFNMFIVSREILSSSLLRFIDGVMFFGSTVYYDELMDKAETMTDVFSDSFYKYMRRRGDANQN